jgi:pimeloyl-ACP methyl ester carboxylesterase
LKAALSITGALLKVYLVPITASSERQPLVRRYVAPMNCSQTLRIHQQLKAFVAPTLIAWGDDDLFLPVSWAHWLGDTIPGTRRVAVLKRREADFPEEKADEFCELLREHWQASV